MKSLSTVTGILTFPARTAGAVAAAGLRTTSRVVGWAVEQAVGSSTPAERSLWPSKAAPVTVPDAPETTELAVEPIAPTRTPAKKSPAKKAPAKKAPAKKAPAKKAPSKKAAVLAPALGLSEDEVLATETDGKA